MSYKLLSYRDGRNARAGVLVGETVYDAAKATGVPAYASVLGMLEDWTRARRALADAAKKLAAGKSRVKGKPLARTPDWAPMKPILSVRDWAPATLAPSAPAAPASPRNPLVLRNARRLTAPFASACLRRRSVMAISLSWP